MGLVPSQIVLEELCDYRVHDDAIQVLGMWIQCNMAIQMEWKLLFGRVSMVYYLSIRIIKVV